MFPFVNGKKEENTAECVSNFFTEDDVLRLSKKTQRNVFLSNSCDTRQNTTECVSCGDERRKTETASVFPFVIGRMRRTQRNVFPVGDMHLREKGKRKNEDVEPFFFF